MKRQRALRLGLAVAVIGSLVAAGSATAATGVWKPSNNLGICLNASSSTTVNLGTCAVPPNVNNFQQWEGLQQSNGLYLQRNVAYQRCLSTTLTSPPQVILESCDATKTRMLWAVLVDAALGGTFRNLKNNHWGQCLDSGQASLILGCNGGRYQAWTR